ncbi:MAG: hypothetical protein AB7G75_31965 [Candidatus Binatia bacterium]
MKTTSNKHIIYALVFTCCLIESKSTMAQSFLMPAAQTFAQFRTSAEDDSIFPERPRQRRGWRDERFEQRREARQQKIQRARNLARRLLVNPNTPADVRAKAQHLDELLTKRESLANELIAKRQQFLDAHREELEELRQLRERSERIRQNLRAAREKVLAENMPQIQEVRRLTKETRETAQDIRQQYRGMRGQPRERSSDED